MHSPSELDHPELARISVFPKKQDTAEAVAVWIADAVRQNPTLSITYATGDTMIPVYGALATMVEDGEVDFSRTHAFHLDEYFPCDPTAEYGFVKFLNNHAFAPLHISEKNTHTLNGLAEDGGGEALRYDALLSQGIAVAILGIGPGGHIGFNERNTPFESRTHLADLSSETVHRDRVERGQDSPEQALTQGISNILEAERIILVAYGVNKGEYLHEALYGDLSPACPASALRLVGEKVTLMIDDTAAVRLK